MYEARRSRLRFPDFKLRAVTLSYDDGQIHDKKMLEIMSRYGIKGTFNIGSACYGSSSRPTYLTKEQAIELYNKYDVEVAVHGKKHLALTEVDTSVAYSEILECRDELEKDFKRIIRGSAYAYGTVSDRVIKVLKDCGIVYGRIVGGSEDFSLPADWFRWQGTCHHQNPRLMELVDKFLSEPVSDRFWHKYPRLFYLWGHSYEFNNNNNWELLEKFCEKIGNRDDVWYATNMEVYEYVKAFDNLRFTADGKLVSNTSNIDVYAFLDGKNVLIPKYQTIEIE